VILTTSDANDDIEKIISSVRIAIYANLSSWSALKDEVT